MSDTVQNNSTGNEPDFIDWSSGDREQSKFVTNMIVQVGDSELTLLLYEVLTPYIQPTSNDPEAYAAKWKNKIPLEATCHGRFVFTPERCEQLVELLQRQLDLFNENWIRKYDASQRRAQNVSEEDPTPYSAQSSGPHGKDDEL